MNVFPFRTTTLAVAGLALWLLSACSWGERVEDLQSATFRPDVAVPLISTTVSTDRLFEELGDERRFIRVGSDGLVSLVYADSLYTLNLGDSLRVDDFDVPVPAPSISFPITLLGINTLARGTVREGSVGFRIQTATANDYQLRLTLDNVTRNGNALTFTRNFSGSSYQLPLAQAAELDGTTIDFTGGEVEMSYQLINQNLGTSEVPTDLTLNLRGLSFSYVEGDLQNASIVSDVETRNTDALSRFEGVDLEVRGARLVFDLDNSIGLPLRLQLGQFTAMNSRSGQTVAVMKNNHPLVSGQVFDYPALNQVGQTVMDSVVFSDDNANLRELSGLFPDEATLEYQGSVEPGLGFITDSSRLRIAVRTEVPLDLRARGVSYRDTSDLTFSWPQADMVEEAQLKLITENGLPLELVCQVYFLDDDAQVVDSLLDASDRLLAAAPVGPDGFVRDTARRELLITVPIERYRRISTTNQVSYRLAIQTSEQGNRLVKFTNQNTLGLKLGLRTRLAADLNTIGTN